MIVGVPKEIKQGEFRVALTPGGVEALRAAGHRVLVQRGSGEHAGFPDKDNNLRHIPALFPPSGKAFHRSTGDSAGVRR